MSSYRLTVSTPNGNRFDEQAVGLYVRGCEGDLAVLAGHIPFVTTVKEGVLHIEMPDGTLRYARSAGGLLTVAAESVTLLTGEWNWTEDR